MALGIVMNKERVRLKQYLLIILFCPYMAALFCNCNELSWCSPSTCFRRVQEESGKERDYGPAPRLSCA